MDGPTRILVIGYGNPGRLDDGLGPAFAEAVEALGLPHVTVEADYQLTVEDAEAVARHDLVIFADAAVDAPTPCYLRRVEPEASVSFTTHSVSPAAVLGLARELFGATAEGWLLGIRGVAFAAFGEGLSPEARANLRAALELVEPILRSGRVPAAVDSPILSGAGAGG